MRPRRSSRRKPDAHTERGVTPRLTEKRRRHNGEALSPFWWGVDNLNNSHNERHPLDPAPKKSKKTQKKEIASQAPTNLFWHFESYIGTKTLRKNSVR